MYFLAVALLLSLTTLTTRSFAADEVTANVATTERAQQIKSRVEDIKHMDKSNLTREERRDLRHELKDMRKEAKEMRGGVYLSIGAILIIILVLILIL